MAQDASPTVLIATVVVPLLYLAVYVDYALSRAQGRHDYDIKDTATSLNVSVIGSVLSMFTVFLRVVTYAWAYQYLALFEWSMDGVWVWVLGFLLYDFSYYWHHRLAHTWHVFWASHVVHHSSERFNLSTAMRMPTVSIHLYAWIFALPLAVVGMPPEVFALISMLNLWYQFWLHTERVGKLGWFDRCFGSPSNHRVHHAINDRYLNKNFGSMLMLWDHIFGTFAEEDPADPPRYGTRDPVRSWDPLWINLATPVGLLRQIWAAPRWRDKLRSLWMPPDWVPEGVPAKAAFVLSQHHRYDSTIPPGHGTYTLVQGFLLWPLMLHQQYAGATLGLGAILPYTAYLVWSCVGLGLLLSPSRTRRRVGRGMERLRMLGSALLALIGAQWFVGVALQPWAIALILLTAVASVLALRRMSAADLETGALHPVSTH